MTKALRSAVQWLCGCAVSAALVAQPARPPQAPHFGTEDLTYTTVSGVDFLPANGEPYLTSAAFGRYPLTFATAFLAGVNLPTGASLESIELDYCADKGQAGLNLVVYDVSWDGQIGSAIAFLNPDPNQPVGCTFVSKSVSYRVDNLFRRIVLSATISMTGGDPSLLGVIFGYRLQVSPAPGTASFNDVPTNHPFFQFVEALKASGITGGCQASPPLYCPDSPVTRGQMAVFLSKALGLAW